MHYLLTHRKRHGTKVKIQRRSNDDDTSEGWRVEVLTVLAALPWRFSKRTYSFKDNVPFAFGVAQLVGGTSLVHSQIGPRLDANITVAIFFIAGQYPNLCPHAFTIWRE